MRGKGNSNRWRASANGITPAHAGKSATFSCQTLTGGDHPRACGEKTVSSKVKHNLTGSPPRMRGKAVRDLRGLCRRGITPAHAGKRCDIMGHREVCGDHPRACGEKSIASACLFASAGSPPRMRGKGSGFAGYRLLPGITPAHAGKSLILQRHRQEQGDHPRACGEKFPLLCCRWCLLGSPPRMRGKVASNCTRRCLVGITPAHAGKSRYGNRGWNSARDHPRACGEKFSSCISRWSDMGSPPRMRGKAALFLKKSVILRDHPRACGEKLNFT